jgi:hypothetical protein
LATAIPALVIKLDEVCKVPGGDKGAAVASQAKEKRADFTPMAMLWRTGTAITKEMGAGW